MNKTFIMAAAAVLCLALFVQHAAAATIGKETRGKKGSYVYKAFNNTTTAGNSSLTSNVYDISGWDKVHVTTYGKTVLGNHSSIEDTGSTIAVQQAPTASGPWETAFENTTGMQPMSRDTTKTANKELNFLRFVWTKVRQGCEVFLTVEEE
jgi:hypothetical protein